MNDYETIILGLIAFSAGIWFLGVGILLVRDCADRRVCAVCGKRKIDNIAHYEGVHKFKPIG